MMVIRPFVVCVCRETCRSGLGGVRGERKGRESDVRRGGPWDIENRTGDDKAGASTEDVRHL